MKTYTAKKDELNQGNWYLIDAEGQTLGRLATRVATLLRGKNKPVFSPHQNIGDHVVVINAEKVHLSGRKMDQKTYFRHSGYPGGMRITPVRRVLDTHPERVIFHAVKGMLPKNNLGRALMKKLRVFPGPEHKHHAQKPQPITLDEIK